MIRRRRKNGANQDQGSNLVYETQLLGGQVDEQMRTRVPQLLLERPQASHRREEQKTLKGEPSCHAYMDRSRHRGSRLKVQASQLERHYILQHGRLATGYRGHLPE